MTTKTNAPFEQITTCSVPWCERHLDDGENATTRAGGWFSEDGDPGLTRIHERKGTFFDLHLWERWHDGTHITESPIADAYERLVTEDVDAMRACARELEEFARLADTTA